MKIARKRLVLIAGPAAALMLGYTASNSFGESPAGIEVNVASSIDRDVAGTSADNRAASFAARAVAKSGLADDTGRLFDYLKTEQAGTTWKATFENGGCLDDSCDLGSQEPLRVVVEEMAFDTFRISDVKGPVSEDERAELLVYQETNRRAVGWTFPAAEVDEASGRISGSPVWEGSINAAGVGSKCSPVVRDSSGTELWRGDPFDLGPPGDEEERAGENVVFPVLSEDLQQENPSVECEAWTGGGWQLEGPAEAHRQNGANDPHGRATIAVAAGALWDGESFMQAFTECTATLRDESGSVVGTGTERFTSPPPQPESERPVVSARAVVILAQTEHPDGVRRADVQCHPITADEFEGGR